MHQPFEEDRPHRSPFRAGDFRYREFYCKGFGVDPEMQRERLEMLRFEEGRVFNPNDAIPGDEPLFWTKDHHPLDFECQCKRCVQKTTINMEDAKFLRGIKVLWRVPSEQQSGTQDGGNADAQGAPEKSDS